MTNPNKGTLTVIQIIGKSYIISCTCGNIFRNYKSRWELYSGRGCAKCKFDGKKNPNYKHGGYKEHQYTRQSYDSMKKRCYNKNNSKYKYYGGRGIKICDRWLESFGNFLEDMGKRPKGLTIDRVDNDGDYTPENCKWSTQKEQVNNARPKGTC